MRPDPDALNDWRRILRLVREALASYARNLQAHRVCILGASA